MANVIDSRAQLELVGHGNIQGIKNMLGTVVSGFQEADVCAVTQCTTKASFLVTDPAKIFKPTGPSLQKRVPGKGGPTLSALEIVPR